MPFIPGFKDELLPDGKYLARIVDVSAMKDKNSNEYWILSLRINDNVIEDKMFFSEKAIKTRTRPMLKALGFDISNDIDLSDPKMLIEKKCVVEIITDTSKEKPTNIVKPFGGYHKMDEDNLPDIKKSDLDEVPF
jgi:hypothetical protein